MASNTLCLSRTANSFAQQHHITKAFVNEFKLRTNITFLKITLAATYWIRLARRQGNRDIFVAIKVRTCEI